MKEFHLCSTVKFKPNLKGVNSFQDVHIWDQTCKVPILERHLSCRETKKGSKESQRPALSVCFTEESVSQRCPLRELTVFFFYWDKIPVNCSSLISFKSLVLQWSPRAASTNLWAFIFWSAKETVMSLCTK